jgi:acetyl esterase/lipase
MAFRDAAADKVAVELLPFIRFYKSSRIERLIADDTVPASLHDAPTGVASKDVTIDPATNASVRMYLPPPLAGAVENLPVVVYFHGGGFMVESAASVNYHRYLNALAARAGAVVVSVDYRRVPEHRLPAAYDDSWAALAWVAACCGDSTPEPWLVEHGDSTRVFLAGDSAGANIAHNGAMRAAAGGPRRPSGACCCCSPTSGTCRTPLGPSWRSASPRVAVHDRESRRPGALVDDPWLSPTSAGAPPLALLPTQRVLVAVAGLDFLATKGRAYHAALLASGWRGVAELEDTPGVDQVFHLTRPGTEAAEKLMDRVVAFLARA